MNLIAVLYCMNIKFSKIYFGETLSYIGVSELACSAFQLIGLYIGYRGLKKIFDYVTLFFVLF